MTQEDGRMQAIVAEDDPSNRLVLCRMLDRMGYDVMRATNGEQAVKLARRGDAPILFMDLHMPGTDGYEAVRAIRAERTTSQIRVVAVTGDVTARAGIACREAGFDSVLAKPVRLEAVEAELAHARAVAR